MNGAAAVAAVTALLKGVEAAGPNVYGSIRYSRDPDTYNTLFLDAGAGAEPTVHTWMVTRKAVKGMDEEMQAARAKHIVVASGYRAFQDNVSEPVFQAEVDAIVAAMIPYAQRHLQTLGSNVYFDWSGPPSAENIRLVFFGSVLCHTADIVFPVEEFPLS